MSKYKAPEGVRTVCLVGSSRFKEKFHQIGESLEKQGVLVLMMSFFQHADNVPVSPEERAILRQVDERRIDHADEVWVVSEGGYVGEDTRREIEYATGVGRLLRFCESMEGQP